MKVDLKKIVVSRETAAQLVVLGIAPFSALRWFRDYVLDLEPEPGEGQPFFWDVGDIDEPDTIPAWTYEELRVLIGWNHNGAELPEPRPNPMPREEIQYKLHYKDRVKTFESGAETNAFFLIVLLESGELKAEDCNKRFNEKYSENWSMK